MDDKKNDITFEFLDDISSRGTPIKLIQFSTDDFRFNKAQKETLKTICQGYFFYIKIKQKWGFTHLGNNELYVYDYLKFGTVPEHVLIKENIRNYEIKKDDIPFNLNDFEITFFELTGRPLFYYENNKGKIKININLAHWFFEKKDPSEKEIVKKIILSIVGTELEYSSQVIDSFFIKLNSVQENLKYTYGKS